MKRLFRLTLITALMLLLTAALCCALAEAADHEHFALCNNPTVCTVCGAPYSGSNVYHTFSGDEPAYQYDAQNHWKICPTCNGYLEDPNEHWCTCDNPGVCRFCGQPCSTENMSHTLPAGQSWDSLEWQGDVEKHWQTCPTCGKTMSQGEHYAACDNPGVCARCGVAYTGDRVSHQYDSSQPYQFDGTYHWRICSRCGGVMSKSNHWANCDKPNECAECGAPYSGDNVQHDWSSPLQSDATYHWRVCTRCGATFNKGRHYAACDKPGTCEECGAAYTGTSVSHEVSWDTPYLSDANYHWHTCTRCGEPVNKDEHFISCDKPGVCDECGAAYTGSNVRHTYNREDPYQSDATYHWRVCSKCGEAANKSRHWATCDKPNECAECGAAYSGDNVEHDWDSPYQSNADEHWKVCTRCGQEFNRSTHYASCANPGVCEACGAAYTGSDVSHNWESPYQYDANYHWKVCIDCGKVFNRSEHRAACDNPGVCVNCSAPYTGPNVSHSYNWDDPFQYDETYHWHICTKCGQVADKSEHWARCDKPNECVNCGAPYSGDDIEHDWNSPYQSNATEHWKVCRLCGKEFSRSTHYASCTNPGVCKACGAAYTGSDISHNWDSPVQSDATYHWRVCIDCGQTFGKSTHYAACNNPGVCEECGVAYTGSNVNHLIYGSTPYQSDANYHWQICSRCGEVAYKSEHWASCDKPGVCAVCGAAYTGGNIQHDWQFSPYEHDERQHWQICTRCGKTFGNSQHYASCANPGVCEECGATGTFRIEHVWDSPYGYDETNHWKICSGCGEIFNKSEHFASCANPGVCVNCGAAYTGTNVQHNWDSPYQHDANSHWRVCVDCGETFSESEHSASCTNPGVCYLCGEPYTGENRSHGYTGVYYAEGMYHWMICPDCGEVCYKGLHEEDMSNPGMCTACGAAFNVTGFTWVKLDKYYKVLTINGVIETAATGLINDPAAPSDWYYCVEGRALTDITRLVDYDGAWFYVTNGKLDTTFAGIVGYDGGLFVVGAGRIMTEIQGLVQDPASKAWAYCGDGMVQTQYTGLAQYDGAWFYIVKGWLDESYTGDVQYDGQTFHVKNGQLVV